MTENEFLAQASLLLHPMRPMPVTYEDVPARLKDAADPEEVAELEKRVEALEEDCAKAEDERDAALDAGAATQMAVEKAYAAIKDVLP